MAAFSVAFALVPLFLCIDLAVFMLSHERQTYHVTIHYATIMLSTKACGRANLDSAFPYNQLEILYQSWSVARW